MRKYLIKFPPQTVVLLPSPFVCVSAFFFLFFFFFFFCVCASSFIFDHQPTDEKSCTPFFCVFLIRIYKKTHNDKEEDNNNNKKKKG